MCKTLLHFLIIYVIYKPYISDFATKLKQIVNERHTGLSKPESRKLLITCKLLWNLFQMLDCIMEAGVRWRQGGRRGAPRARQRAPIHGPSGTHTATHPPHTRKPTSLWFSLWRHPLSTNQSPDPFKPNSWREFHGAGWRQQSTDERRVGGSCTCRSSRGHLSKKNHVLKSYQQFWISIKLQELNTFSNKCSHWHDKWSRIACLKSSILVSNYN